MDIFEELLQNTKGFPADQRQDIQSTAETLMVIGALSKADLQQSTQYILDHLPELRLDRARLHDPYLKAKSAPALLTGTAAEPDAQISSTPFPPLHMQKPSEQFDGDGLRLFDIDQARRFKSSAEKLATPRVDEQYKRRVALVELSIRLKVRLREAAQVDPELDPVRLKKFRAALGAVAGSLPDDVGDKVERELMARFQFVQELRDAGGDTDLAVDNFYKAAFSSDRERGHWGDVEVGEEEIHLGATFGDPDQAPNGLATQSLLGAWVERQDRRERADANRVLQSMPKIAAEHLNPKQYAAYRVLIDNNHLIDWKIKDGKIRFKAKELDASDDSNTVGKILQREMDYQNIRGATLLITETVGKLNTLLRGYDGQEVVQTEKGRERLAKSTAEILADPAAKARKSHQKGKGGPGL
ncbi:MAG: hypothetical protein ACYCS8_04815 [Acidithiobacillus sp.]